jgi:hypothetical protein
MINYWSVMMKRKWLSLSVLACIGCCAMPFIIGATSGIAAITAIGADFWICGGVLLGGAVAWYIVQRQARTRCASTGEATCSTDCGCKDKR